VRERGVRGSTPPSHIFPLLVGRFAIPYFHVYGSSGDRSTPRSRCPCIRKHALEKKRVEFDPCISRIGGRAFFEDGDYGANARSSLSDWHNPICVMTGSKDNLQHMVGGGVFVAIFLNVIITDGEAVSC